jgi:hypothetical protein
MPEFLPQRFTICRPPLKRATMTIPAQETYETPKPREDNIASPLSIQRGDQDTSSLAASLDSSNTTSPSPEHKHIHFNELVEQCIAIDIMDDHDYDSSSSDDDDGIMMKQIRPKKRISWYKEESRRSENSDGKIIAKLPPGHLRYGVTTPKIAIDTASRVSLRVFFLALRPPTSKYRNYRMV